MLTVSTIPAILSQLQRCAQNYLLNKDTSKLPTPVHPVIKVSIRKWYYCTYVCLPARNFDIFINSCLPRTSAVLANTFAGLLL